MQATAFSDLARFPTTELLKNSEIEVEPSSFQSISSQLYPCLKLAEAISAPKPIIHTTIPVKTRDNAQPILFPIARGIFIILSVSVYP